MYGFSKKKVFALTGAVCLAAFMLLACPTNDPPIIFLPPIGGGTADWDVSFDPATGSMTIAWYPVSGAVMYDVTHAGSRFSRNFVYLDTISASLDCEEKITFTHTIAAGLNPARFENYYRIYAFDENFEEIATFVISLRLGIFGPSVVFFDAKHDHPADIATEINRIHSEETWGLLPTSLGLRAQFGGRRYIIFFMPGEYHFPPGTALPIGFYTSFVGLGRFPSCVRFFNANVHTPPHLTEPLNNATQTFWRSIENIEIVTGSHFRWGVSQSAPARRLMVRVPTYLHYLSGWGSGGFIADSWFSGPVDGGSQQQWYNRNIHFEGSAMGGVTWNKTIQASTGVLPTSTPGNHVTLIPNAPFLRERPFIYLDEDGEFRVFVPGVRRDAVGISWNNGSGENGMNTTTENGGMGPGQSLDFLDTFYITRVELRDGDHFVGLDNAASINAQLNAGRNIFFVPGTYHIESPIVVGRANTVVLGKGFPALRPTGNNRDGVVFVQDVPGVSVAGLLFDTTDQSVYSIAVGHTGANGDHSDNPILLADLVVRAGGQFWQGPNHVDISVLINSNNVIGDKLWIWRADHNGRPNGFNTIDWHINTTINGLVVFGDDVHMYGLFVEHYHQYNTLWIGNGGRIFFYQNELPYDPHYQWQYMSHGGTVRGWSQIKVHHDVTDFRAYGVGMYCVFIRSSPARPNGNMEDGIRLQNAIEVPHHPGVRIENAVITFIGTAGFASGIESIVNGIGGSVLNGFGTARINWFENGQGQIGPVTNTGSTPHTVGSVQSGNEPAPKVHWVESLVVNASGIVTANPYGGLPCFSEQFPGTSWNQPAIQQ